MASAAKLAVCFIVAGRIMAAPMLGMDFGPPMSVVVNGGMMHGKASNTLDLYPHGFAYSGAGDEVKTVIEHGVSYSLAPYSVDGGKTFLNASFRPTYQQSWTSFAYFNSSGDLWAHDFGTTNELLLASSRNATSISSNSTFSYRFEKGELTRTPGPGVNFSGFTVPFCPQEPKYPDGFLELYASSHMILPDGSHLQTAITQWCSPPLPRGACSAILAFTSKDGYNYEYVSNVSTCIENPSAEGGPNEHDCTLLPSGDVMCVMRTASGYARGMRGAPFYMTTSGDGGRSWSKPVALVDLDGNAMGCARPHLLQLGSAILLSGGRLMMGRDYNDGFSVWLSEDAARTWTRADVSYHHNSKANVSKVPLVPPAVNTTKGSTAKGWFGTSGYAGLVRVGEMSAAILYDWDFWSSSESRSDIHGLHPPYESLAFSMRIDLVSAKQDTPFTPPGI